MSTLPDLNDYRLFACVVEENGFSAAGRRLALPRSHVSRRISAMEDRQGVRLVHRSTRSFSVTELGRAFYRQCQAMLMEADAATALIESQQLAPRGTVKVSCPSSLIQQQVGAIIIKFMMENPQVEVILDSTNRRVDVLREGFDLAIRIRMPPLEDSDLVVRRLGADKQFFVASPALLAQDLALHGPITSPADLSRLPSFSWHPEQHQGRWDFEGPNGELAIIPHQPRLLTQDMSALTQAVLSGLVAGQLPGGIARTHIARGGMVELLPDWHLKSGVAHVVFPSRRGVLPAVRALLEALAQGYDAQAQPFSLSG